MSFDAERAHREMQALAFPRRSGSPGAEQARAYLLARLHEAGLTPVLEPFTFSGRLVERIVPAVVLAVAGLVLAATLAYFVSPAGSLALLLLGFLAGLPATRWSYRVERLLDSGELRQSANIVATLTDPPHPRRHVLLMAHSDSKSQRLPIAVRTGAALGALGGGGLLLLGALWGGLRPGGPLPAGVVVGAGLISTLGLGVLALNPSGNASPGALDNAAGVGVLLELARAVPALGLQQTRVTLVITGAEEEGLAGAVRFFQAHEGRLGPEAVLINLDSPGAAPEVTLLSVFGLPPMGAAPDLVRLARAAARTAGIPVRTLWLPAGAGTDHFPAALRGIAAVTLASLGPAFRRSHTPLDTPAGVLPEGLGNAGRLVLALLRALDTEE